MRRRVRILSEADRAGRTSQWENSGVEGTVPRTVPCTFHVSFPVSAGIICWEQNMQCTSYFAGIFISSQFSEAGLSHRTVSEMDGVYRSNLTDGLFLLDISNNQRPRGIQRRCVIICIRIISLVDSFILQWKWKLEIGRILDRGRKI